MKPAPLAQFPSQIIATSDHRPFPMPSVRPWVMAQSWQRLLFAHWRIAPQTLRPLIPAELEIDTFDGSAWIAVVPFQMAHVRARMLPEIPGTATFPELNVRTYVRHRGIAGVWFLSLDAANLLAVKVARALFHLLYYHARMSIAQQGDAIHYRSERFHVHGSAASFQAEYRPTGAVQTFAADSLEHWLTERYVLFAADRQQRLFRGDIQHRIWSLQPAEAHIQQNRMALAAGIELPDTPPHLLYADRIDVLTWFVQRV
jgi:hypothetical protein